MRNLDESPIYYVYEHYRPGWDEPFWVGKGKERRADSMCGRNKWWENIVNKYGYEIRFVAENLTEMNAFWLETMCIRGWGRADLKEGPLVTMTDGGEGLSGAKRPKHSKRMRGKGNPMYGNHRWKGENNPMFGKTHEKSMRENQSKAMKNKRFIRNIRTNAVRIIGNTEILPKGWVFGSAVRFIWKANNNDNIITGKSLRELSTQIGVTLASMFRAYSKGYKTKGYTITRIKL